jgi:hypothetical protein
MDPPKNYGPYAFVRVKLGHGNVGFVASRLTIPTASRMAREVPKRHTCKSLRIKGDDRPEARVRSSMPTACGQQRIFGRRRKSASGSHFISWNRTTKETGSELIQAMALKGQNCYGKKRDTDQHRQFHSSFCEISRSYLLASRLHVYLRVIVRCKIELSSGSKSSELTAATGLFPKRKRKLWNSTPPRIGLSCVDTGGMKMDGEY